MQHYTVHLFLENFSTCFGWYPHPSSGAHTIVFAVSTYVTDRYNSHITLRSAPTLPQQTQVAVTVNKYQILQIQLCAPDDGWRYHPKHVEQFSKNK